jgi:hypothetical protein
MLSRLTHRSYTLRFPVLSGNWMRASIAPALVFIATATDQQYLADFWHHLARGQAIVTQGRLLNQDQFTYTVAGRPFIDANWLAQVCYYALYQQGGLSLVQFINAVLLAAMMALLVWSCRRACGSLGVAAAVGVFTFLGLWQTLTIRPQSFSLLLFVLLHAILDLSERREWLLLLPPFLLALWANLHGGFPIGLVLIGSFVAAAAWQSWTARKWTLITDGRLCALTLCLGASVAATLINPYGWHVYEYVSTTSSAAAARRIDEWLPPGFDMLIGKFWAASLVLLLLGFALSTRRPSTRDVCLALCLLPLACGSARMVVWWLLATAPVLAASLSALPSVAGIGRRPEKRSAAAALCFFIIGLMAVLSIPGVNQYNPLLGPTRRPEFRRETDIAAAAKFIADRVPSGRIFSRFEWGEYLTWFLGPRFPVFMDGRIEIFPDDVWSQYATVTVGRGEWQEILEHYRVDYLLLDARYHAATGLLSEVQQSRRWQCSFRSGDALLYARYPSPPRLPPVQ